MSAGVEPKARFSRRDFFKLAGGLAVGAGLLAGGVELGNDPHFINGLKVTKELAEAEISGDPEKIFESRKLAMVWLFAETSAKYSQEMGLGGAGLTMEHYLYGNGEPLDISFLLEKVVAVEPERFVSELISSAINHAENNVTPNISPEKDYIFTKRALKELMSEAGLKTALDARTWIGNWDELYNAFGGAKYILHAKEAGILSQEQWGQTVILEQGIDIEASDRYYWQLDHEMGLNHKSSRVARYVLETLFDRFYESHDIVEKTVTDLGLSNEQVRKIMAIYSNDRNEQVISDLSSATYDFVEESTLSLTGRPDLVENDLNLLKKLGAQEYDMRGHVHIPNRLEIYV